MRRKKEQLFRSALFCYLDNIYLSGSSVIINQFVIRIYFFSNFVTGNCTACAAYDPADNCARSSADTRYY
jgi:hypothetical protein